MLLDESLWCAESQIQRFQVEAPIGLEYYITMLNVFNFLDFAANTNNGIWDDTLCIGWNNRGLPIALAKDGLKFRSYHVRYNGK